MNIIKVNIYLIFKKFPLFEIKIIYTLISTFYIPHPDICIYISKGEPEKEIITS